MVPFQSAFLDGRCQSNEGLLLLPSQYLGVRLSVTLYLCLDSSYGSLLRLTARVSRTAKRRRLDAGVGQRD